MSSWKGPSSRFRPFAGGRLDLDLTVAEKGFENSDSIPPYTLRLRAASPLEDGLDLGGNWRLNEWLTYYFLDESGWAYHRNLGWLFAIADAEDSGVLVHLENIGWCWTTPDAYPHFWWFGGNAGQGTWLTSRKRTRDPRWFYDWSFRTWRRFE